MKMCENGYFGPLVSKLTKPRYFDYFDYSDYSNLRSPHTAYILVTVQLS